MVSSLSLNLKKNGKKIIRSIAIVPLKYPKPISGPLSLNEINCLVLQFGQSLPFLENPSSQTSFVFHL